MQDLLSQLNRIRGIGGSMLVSADGLAMATALRADIDDSVISAAIGDLLGAAKRICDGFHLGPAAAFQAGADQQGMLIMSAGPAYVLLVIDPGANLALLQLEARGIIERIGQRLAL